MGAQNVCIGPVIHHIEIGAFGHREGAGGHGPDGVIELAGGNLQGDGTVEGVIPPRYHGGILLE